MPWLDQVITCAADTGFVALGSNSKGKSVPVKEVGWASANETPDFSKASAKVLTIFHSTKSFLRFF